jgi:uncharacterized damage-inducible protein DinB
MSLSLLASLFDYKAWANRELFDVLAGIPPETDLHAATRTLNHIYVVDRIFRAHLLGEAHGYDATNTSATPTLAQLRDAAAETDNWYCEYVAALSEVQLKEPVKFTFTDGDSGTMSREEILMHVITHGGYHRGNVGQILKNIGIAPPRDIFTKFLHTSEPQRRSA